MNGRTYYEEEVLPRAHKTAESALVYLYEGIFQSQSIDADSLREHMLYLLKEFNMFPQYEELLEEELFVRYPPQEQYI